MQYNVREIRQAMGLSQEDLAEKSGISRATIVALENGQDKVTTTKTLLKIADALGVPLDAIFSGPNA